MDVREPQLVLRERAPGRARRALATRARECVPVARRTAPRAAAPDIPRRRRAAAGRDAGAQPRRSRRFFRRTSATTSSNRARSRACGSSARVRTPRYPDDRNSPRVSSSITTAPSSPHDGADDGLRSWPQSDGPARCGRRAAGGAAAAAARLPAAFAPPGAGTDLTVAVTQFGRAVRTLVAEGWHVEAEGAAFRTAQAMRLQVKSGIDWFELHGDLDFGDGRSCPSPRCSPHSSVAKARSGSMMARAGWCRRSGCAATPGSPGSASSKATTSDTGRPRPRWWTRCSRASRRSTSTRRSRGRAPR